MNSYEKQAQDFLDKTGAKLDIKFLRKGKHFQDDQEERDIYVVTLSRGSRRYEFNFGQSLVNSEHWKDKATGKTSTDEAWVKRAWGYGAIHKKRQEPTPYDILTCLTKYNPGTFEDFCDDFGYDKDSRRAFKTYEAVRDEFLHIQAMFSDYELEVLSEIQ